MGKRLVRVLYREVLEEDTLETGAYFGAGDIELRVFHGRKKYNTLIYTMHWVFNVVVLKVNKIGAVLIRAIEPTLRMESMPNYRPIDSSRALTSDPRELVLA